MPKLRLLLPFLFISTLSFSQVFSGYGGNISNTGSRNFFSQSISGLSGGIDSKFGVFGVTVNITHSNDGDLDIFLVAPDQTVVELSSGNGENSKNYDNCFFTNTSKVKISSGKAPFKGTFKPEGSLGVINNGQSPNGNWRLLIIDTRSNKDSGKLVNWNIIFSSTPSQLEPFVNSSLPLILINTHNKTIPDEPRVSGEMHIINNSNQINKPGDSSKFYKHRITIEARGSTSQSFPKRPYGFTTVMKSQADSNVSLLGLPAEHDWTLNATYNDKSLMRDVLAYELARRTGRYATRYRYCEMFINGKYEGIYILMEKVKRDKNRVDIAKLEPKDSTGDNVTGGYIVKIDKTTGNNNGGWTDSFPISQGSSGRVYFQYDYPNGDDMMKQQKEYIKNYIYKFEIALSGNQFMSPTNGYRQFADVNTFIDLSIINEISKNVDGYRLSTYLFKDKDSKGGKLKMGPVWDFNLAFNNADYNNSSSPEGWEIDLSYGCPFWWKRFRSDTGYVNAYYCRWNQLRQSIFQLYNINKFIDSTYAVLEEASYRNFQRWPVLGLYIWPNPSPLSYSMKEEVVALKSWIEKRCNWMDSELSVDCKKVNTCKPKVVMMAEKSSVCKYQPVKLYADGLGTSFTWSPTKGLNTASGREVIATLDATTTFKVIMKTKAGCMDSATLTIKVLPLPAKTISGGTSICEGFNTVLSVPAGAKTYLWSPATGLDNPSLNKVKAAPTYNILYKVTVVDSMGCRDSNYVTVNVHKKPIVAISAPHDSICAMDSILLTASGATTYNWLPAVGLKDLTGNAVVVYPKNTEYKVIGTSDKGCIDTASYFIFEFPPSSINISALSKQLCYGEITMLTAGNGKDFTWKPTLDFGGSNSGIIIVSPKVNTNYSLTGLNKFGCRDSTQVTIGVYPEMQIAITGNNTICKGQETILTASGAGNYSWSPATGLNATTGTTVAASPLQTATYRLIGVSNGKCYDTLDFDIHVNNLPALVMTLSSDSIEEGESATIEVAGADDYLWTPNKWLDTNLGNKVIASPMETTTYSVKGTDKNQCSSSDSVLITVTKKQVGGIYPAQHPEFVIYPNPVTNFVYIKSFENAILILYNATGAEVLRTLIEPGINQLNLNILSPGVYIFKLGNDSSDTYYRLVKD